MKTIRWWIDKRIGDTDWGEFAVDDSATDDEIEVEAKKYAFNTIDCRWREIKADE